MRYSENSLTLVKNYIVLDTKVSHKLWDTLIGQKELHVAIHIY